MTATDPKSGESINSVPLDIDDVATTLSNSRRRFTIRYVDENPPPAEVGNLAEAIAELEQNQPMSQLNAQDRKRVYVALLQEHLPTLHEIDAINYDECTKSLMPTTRTRSLAKVVRVLESICDGGTLPKP